jgi:phosphoribosylaminoimidazole-succinocarboxamide synthase
MALENLALSETSNFPIRHVGNVHSGKVRSVYWLNDNDSNNVYKKIVGLNSTNAHLGVMIISDRISAFDVNWKGEDGLSGVPGKGAALNAISQYWFHELEMTGIGENHILDAPHPLVWIVQKAEPIMVEAIARQYITGSMLRDYNKGVREFCGNYLPEGLMPNQKLHNLLITPTTKGIMKEIPGVPEKDDTNITRKQIEQNYRAFGFKSVDDIFTYERMLTEGFDRISNILEVEGQIFVDTKFEFGYVQRDGVSKMIFIDEIGTPDSSRMWDKNVYPGKIIENSKEGFRQFLLNTTDKNILLDSTRMDERKELAKNYKVPLEQMMKVSETYKGMASKILSTSLSPQIVDARAEIIDSLSSYGIIELQK